MIYLASSKNVYKIPSMSYRNLWHMYKIAQYLNLYLEKRKNKSTKYMNKKTTNKSGINAKTVVGVVAGVAAMSAAAYVLFGPDAKKNKKAIRGWAIKMKGDIIEKFENAKEITEPVYHKIVDEAHAKYAKLKNVDMGELEAVVADVKKHWKTMQRDMKPKKKVIVKKK